LLQTAQAIALSSPGSSGVSVRVLFDSGSQLSYVTENLKRQLRLKPVKIERLHLNTFGTRNYKTQECNVVKLFLQGHEQGEAISISALTSPVICSPLPSAVHVDKYSHLRGLQLADNYNATSGEIDVLIGSNYYWNVVSGDTVRGDHGPVAVNSKLGWLLSGTVDSIEAMKINHTHLIISGSPANPLHTNDNVLMESLERFWEVESIGVMDPSAVSSRKDPFLPSISFENGRYEVGLPWKGTQCVVPDHLTLCEARLKSLLKRLRLNPQMLSEYDKIIQDQLNQGIVEYVKDLEKPNVFEGEFHYLPHHGVVRQESETTKLRIVYNGSARAIGDDYSLNDCLLTGPNCIPKLFNILIQFRWNLIAVTADIEKAFLMVGIKPSDRNYLRFLWMKDPSKTNSEVIHLRFTRLVFGLRPSPAVLGSVINHHVSQCQIHNSTLTEKLLNSLYVDDLVTSTPDTESAYEFHVESKRIMAAASMNLRKWHSNSPELLKKMNSNSHLTDLRRVPAQSQLVEEDDTYTKTVIGSNVSTPSQGLTKVLGVLWNSVLDVLRLKLMDWLSMPTPCQ